VVDFNCGFCGAEGVDVELIGGEVEDGGEFGLLSGAGVTRYWLE
jgi:hypothetical protein